MVNGLSHRYHLGKSTVILRGIGFDFSVLFHFSMTFLSANRKAPDVCVCMVARSGLFFNAT